MVVGYCLRSPDAAAKLEVSGVTKENRIICYCGGGISATIDLFLLHQLGYDNPTLYVGSMGRGIQPFLLRRTDVLPIWASRIERSMAALVQSRRFRDVSCESALPPRTDVVSFTDHVGKMPKRDVLFWHHACLFVRKKRPRHLIERRGWSLSPKRTGI
jgi:hypothetical protein